MPPAAKLALLGRQVLEGLGTADGILIENGAGALLGISPGALYRLLELRAKLLP